MMRTTLPGDRTPRAVAEQFRAMECATNEIGDRDPLREGMLLRTWTAAEVEQKGSWLRHKNANGHDIYIRPSGSQGLVLVDDLAAAAVIRLRHDGLTPAVVLKTSPGNHQA